MNRAELIHRIKSKRSFLCVGLDPELSKIPPHLHSGPSPILDFCKAIVDSTRDLCVAYKPNTAFFEQYGSRGWRALEEVVEYIGKDHFIIADAKRGDIGNTSTMYAKAFFNALDADAITVAPYMGRDSVSPFFEFEGKWAIVLALTSNPGSADFQLTSLTGGDHLFEEVIGKVASWGNPSNTMFVVGATHPDVFAAIRKAVPDHFLLVPGIGAQGGNLKEVAVAGLNADIGLLVNSSRQIIYASSGEDYAVKAREEAGKIQAEMAVLMESIIS